MQYYDNYCIDQNGDERILCNREQFIIEKYFRHFQDSDKHYYIQMIDIYL